MTGMWGMAGFLAFIPLYTTELGMAGAGPALALYALIVVSLRIVFSKLPDQLGAARLSGFALVGSAIGLAILGLVPNPVGVYLGTAVFATGIAFLFPALLALAVARVDETERGTVVGTTTAFVDLSFGVAPALLGLAVGVIGFGGIFIVSGAIALGGSALLLVRRGTLIAPPRRPHRVGSPGDDRAGVRGGRGADGPRDRPGPCGDRQGRVPLRARPRPAPRPAATGSPPTSTGRSPRNA